MKILYIADSTSIHTKRWVKYFINSGNKIYMITLGKKKKRIQGVEHLANFNEFSYKKISFVPVLMKTRKIIRKIKPDIVHAHFVHQYGWLGALSNYHPFILTAWGTDILNLPKASRFKIGKLVTKYTLRKADLLTATSEYLKSEMLKLGAKENRIHVIFWGVNLKKFRPGVNVNELRKKLKIKKGQKIILSNRNHIKLYNNDIVIRSMSKVLQKFPNTILIMQNADGNCENDLKNLAMKEGIYDSIRFLTKFNYSEMPALYSIADIYISVPSWDAGPVSLKEAMACGTVPIISAIPGPMEWVKDKINGKVVPIRDCMKLADAICELLLDQDQRYRYAEMNIRLIKKNAAHKISMQKMEKLYKEMIKKNNTF